MPYLVESLFNVNEEGAEFLVVVEGDETVVDEAEDVVGSLLVGSEARLVL